MIKAFIFWIIFIGMIVGGLAAGGPASGAVGLAGLWAISSSYVTRKDGGRDLRYNSSWIRFFIGLACLAVAVILSL